jgi:hypothetical protein
MNRHACDSNGQCARDSCSAYPVIQHMVSIDAFGVEDGADAATSDYESLFDTPCDRCDANPLWKHELCSFCLHLRVFHLVTCLQDQSCNALPLIKLGTLTQLRNRKKCKFCSFVAHMFAFARDDRPQDVHAEDAILMHPCVKRLSIKYRRTILPAHLGGPDLLFLTPSEHTLKDFWSIGTEIYAKVVQTQGDKRKRETSPQQRRGTGLNWSKVRAWINESRQDDTNTVLKNSWKKSRLPNQFKVMDLEHRCIVETSCAPEYAALSYVWGRKLDNEVETTKNNIEMLSTVGCFDRIALPQTIRDAIEFCDKLQIRYLWVDRLCIVQDDASQKHDQISTMDAIYSCAMFTICATAGTSSRHGLPGVGTTSRPFARVDLRIADVEVVPILPHAIKCFADGSWFDRGWTFQESLLGGKLFLFTEWQLFFRNNSYDDYDIQPEDELTELDDGWFKNVPAVEHPESEVTKFGSTFEQFATHLGTYSSRKLSYESDTYNAFAGVFRALYHSLDGYIYGLPERDFDVAITWGAFPLSNLDRPREVRDAILPTWSWGSLMHWTPEILIGRHDTFAAIARWARCDARGILKPIVATNDPTAHISGYRWDVDASAPLNTVDPRPYVLAAWCVCLETPSPVLRNLRSSSRAMLRSRWPTYRNFWKEAHSQRIPIDGDMEMCMLTSKPGRLLVRTTTSRYRIWAGNTVGASQDFYILDNGGWCVGTCRIPQAIAKANNLLPTSNADLGMFDFLALSLSFSRDLAFFDNLKRRASHAFMEQASNSTVGFEAPPLYADGAPTTMMEDSEGNPLDLTPLLSVMLIAWNEGIAHRIWLGQVSLTRWINGDSCHRTIVLE